MTADARLALSTVVAVLTCLALARATPVPVAALPTKPVPERSAQALAVRDGLALDPNLATAGDLDLLPGVGPSLARKIIEARSSGGPFREPSDLLRVKGVGQKTLQKLTPFLRFGSHQIEKTTAAQLTLEHAGSVAVDAQQADAKVEAKVPFARN